MTRVTYDPHLEVSFWLFPGNYTYMGVIGVTKVFKLLGCLNCTTERVGGEKTTFVGLEAPLDFSLAHSLIAFKSSFIFKDLTLHPLPNALGQINTMQQPIGCQQATMLLERVTFRDFALTELSTLPATLIYSQVHCEVVFQRVTWTNNSISTPLNHPGLPPVFTSHLLFHGNSDDSHTIIDSLAENNAISTTHARGGLIGAGGAITIIGSTFRNTELFGNASSYGSVIAGLSNQLLVSSCIFENNSVSVLPQVEHSSGPHVFASGGAIALTAGINAIITNTTFIYNRADYGGAVAVVVDPLRLNGSLLISNCTFKLNTAILLGSALYSYTQQYSLDSVVIAHSVFRDNLSVKRPIEDGIFAPAVIFVRDSIAISFTNVTISNHLKDRYLPHDLSLTHRMAFSLLRKVNISGIIFQGLGLGSLDGDVMVLHDTENMHLENVSLIDVYQREFTDQDLRRAWIQVDADADVSLYTSTFTLNGFSNGGNTYSSNSPILHVRNTDNVHITDVDIHHISVRPERPVFFIHNAYNVTIENYKAHSVIGSLTVQDSDHITITDASFTQLGSVLPVLDLSFASFVTLRRLKFNNIRSQGLKVTDTSAIEIHDSSFVDIDATDQDGGAIFLSNIDSTSIHTSQFIRCSAANGGALYAWDSGYFYDSTFINNSANLAGGALYFAQRRSHLTNLQFEGNVAPTGGAVYTETSDVKVYYSNFTSNRALTSSGGAFQLNGRVSKEGVSSLFMQSRFFGNYARSSGGAIDSAYSPALETSFCTFINNIAGPSEILQRNSYLISDFQPVFGLGGAIHTVGSFTSTKSHFNSNVANAGGAVYLEAPSLRDGLVISHSTFTLNIAAHSGGAVLCNSMQLYAKYGQGGTPPQALPLTMLRDSNFTANEAVYYGGALASVGLRVNLSCGNNEFFNNSAKYGGALYYDQGNNTAQKPPYIYSQTFRYNRATSGAIGFFNRINDSDAFGISYICRRLNSCTGNHATGYASIIATGFFYLSWIEKIPTFMKEPMFYPYYITEPPLPTPDPHSFNHSKCSLVIISVPPARSYDSDNNHQRYNVKGDSHDIPDTLLHNNDDLHSLSSLNSASKSLFFSNLDQLLATGFLNNFENLHQQLRSISTQSINTHYKAFQNVPNSFSMAESRSSSSNSANVGAASNMPYPTYYTGVTAHSGITKGIHLQAVDQFIQSMSDDRSFPITLNISQENVHCSPTHCPNVSLANVGNAPVLARGEIDLEINLVLQPRANPYEDHFVNITLSFTGVSSDSPMSWLKNSFLIINILIRSCPEGYGFAGKDKPICQVCPYASYNLNGDGNCVSCASEAKLQCYGKTLVTDEEYWIYTNKSRNKASAYLCPSGYCRGKNSSCAPHRTGILCADCEEGYHESVFSTCTKCDRPNWFLVVLAFILLWLLILVIHMIIAVSSGKSTILFYFVQTAMLFVSDIPPPWDANPNSSICLFPMTPLHRRVLYVLVPIIMLFQILATFAIYWIYMRFIRPLLPEKYRCLKPIIYEDNEDKDDATKPLLMDLDDNEHDKRRITGEAVDIPAKASLERSDSFSSVEPSYTFMSLSIPKDSYTRPNLMPKAAPRINRNAVPPPPGSRKSATSSDSSGSDETNSSSEASSNTHHSQQSTQSLTPGFVAASAPDSEHAIFMPRVREKLVLLGDERNDPSQFIDESDMDGSDAPVHSDFDLSEDDGRFDHYDADASVDEDSVVVPTFGFELTDDEESEAELLESELREWTLTPEYKTRITEHAEADDIVFHSNDSANGPRTLGALRRWVQQKRFFHHYRLIRTVIALVTFSYSAMTTLSFTLFDCVRVRGGGPTFLKIQPSISCYSDEYRRWKYSLIGLVPILFLIVVTIAWKLISGHFKGKLNQADVRFGLLYEMYKPRFFFWKIIELVRRAALTAIFVFINEQAITRGLALSGACFIILVAQALAWPYRRKLENSLETLSTFILSVISIASIWHTKDSSTASSAVIWTLIFFTTFVIIVAFTVSTLRKRVIPQMQRWMAKLAKSKQDSQKQS